MCRLAAWQLHVARPGGSGVSRMARSDPLQSFRPAIARRTALQPRIRTAAWAVALACHYMQRVVMMTARALPRDELALLRIAAGSQVLGYLYNLRLRGRVFSYQSGFDYAAAAALAGPHAKPGITCHHAAILRAQAETAAAYDFLARPDRYKTSLSHAATPLYWLDVAPRFSAQGLLHRVKDMAQRVGTTRTASASWQRDLLFVVGQTRPETARPRSLQPTPSSEDNFSVAHSCLCSYSP